MPAAEMLGHRPRRGRLVDLRTGKARGEDGRGLSCRPRHRRRNRTRVHAAGEERAKGYVRKHVAFDRLQHPYPGLLDPFGLAAALVHAQLRRPEAVEARLPDYPDAQHMSRRDGFDLAKDGTRAEHMAEAEEVVHAAFI